VAAPPFDKRLTPQAGKKVATTPTPVRPVAPPSKVQRILGNPDQTLERVHVGIYDALDRMAQSLTAANINVANAQSTGAGVNAYTTIKLASSAMPQRRNLNFAGGAVVVDNPVTGNTDVTITAGAITGTGDVTWPATSGTAITTLARIPNDTPAVGDILFTGISTPATPGAGLTRVWADTTVGHLRSRASSGIFYSTASGAGSLAPNVLDGFTPSTGQFTSRQVAFSDLTGVIAAAQLPAFTGDVTKPLGSTVQTLANIPNDTPMPGDLFTTVISTPATPSAGHGRAFHLNLGGGLWGFINSVGNVSNTIFPATALAHRWVTNVDSGGFQVQSQPDFSDLTGVIAAAQLPAFTGDVTKPLGSTVQTLANIPNDVPMVGDLLVTLTAAPATPAAGKARVFADSTNAIWNCINSAGLTSITAYPATAPAHQWLTGLASNGAFTSSQPALSDCTPASGGGTTNFLRADYTWAAPPGGGGGITAGTGDVTFSGSGSVVTTLANIPHGTPAAGDISFADRAAVTGGSAHSVLWSDSTDRVIKSNNGTSGFTSVMPLVQSITAGQMVTGLATTGLFNTAAINIPNDTVAAGDILFTNIAAPATPAAGKTRVYVDSTSKNLAAINDAGTINHGVQSKAFAASNFLTSVNDAGVFSAAQPNFTDLAGSAGAAQAPGRLKSFQVLTSGAGATYTRPAGIGSLIIEAWGGGGGGGGVAVSAAAKAGAGGGGGAGAYCKVYVPSPTATMTYTIGTSGTAGANTGGTGGSGGNTTITDATNTITCNSGTGGLGATPAAAPTVTTFGAGGTFSLSGAGWTTLFSCTGNPGSVGHCSGTASTTGWGGHGGTSGPGGGPGQGGPSGGTGIAGTAGSGPGAGGGGGCNNATGTGAVTGGAGSTGRIVVWEFSS